jgi:hypothetical protein
VRARHTSLLVAPLAAERLPVPVAPALLLPSTQGMAATSHEWLTPSPLLPELTRPNAAPPRNSIANFTKAPNAAGGSGPTAPPSPQHFPKPSLNNKTAPQKQSGPPPSPPNPVAGAESTRQLVFGKREGRTTLSTFQGAWQAATWATCDLVGHPGNM